MSPAAQAGTVALKELRDAVRDRRTLLVVFVTSVLLGPLLLGFLSILIGALEEQAEQRELLAVGMVHAPGLQNYLARQNWRVTAAPEDYEQQLRASQLHDPVLRVPADFEAALQRGEPARLELVSDSSNNRSQAAVQQVLAVLGGFSRERATLSLALRGVSVQLLEPVRVHERDLAGAASRGAQLTGMVSYLVLLAVVSGALNAALDTTAGERERGSLEPLMMNPVAGLALAVGKWAAVAGVGMLIAVCSCVSFIPGQWLLQSDTLQALFQFGWREVGLFLLVLLPFAAAVSAVLMAVAIGCKSFKEAQANSTGVMLAVSLLPLAPMMSTSGEAVWHLWVPALAQNTLMLRALKGEGFSAAQVVIPLGVAGLLTALALWYVARQLRAMAVK